MLLLAQAGKIRNITWCQEWDVKMSKFNLPTALSLDGNVAENWNKFKKEFKFFMTATESNDKPEDVKTSRLLSCIGENVSV